MSYSELTALRVVDCSSGIAGAYCAKMFNDAGAEVILVERVTGAPLRSWSCAGTVGTGEDGALFRYLRHGQRSVVATTAEQVHALIADADMVIVDRNGHPAELAADLAGDPALLAASYPHLVVVAISPFGLNGPYAERPASELTVQAESGGLAIRGRSDRPPVQAGGQVTEWVTGAYAAVAAMAALRKATATGIGELIDVSWCEVANTTCASFRDLWHGIEGRPDLTGASPIRSFETPSIEPTLDGYVGFNTNTRQQFESFLLLIDRTDLLAEPDWASFAVRTARWDEWNEIVHAWTTRHTTAEIVERAALLRIPVAPVANAEILLALDHSVQRRVFIDDPTVTFRMPRRPWTIDGEPAPAPQPAPRLGEHNALVVPRLQHRPPGGQVDRNGSAPALPLDGITVVDLTAWWAGPSAAAMLAALGANVIHVESTQRPDGIRMVGGMFAARPQWWELSPFFLAVNTNKRGITLDLGAAAGRSLLLELVKTADLVIENFTPRVIESFDLGWDVIHRTNPRAVMVRMPAFGLDGPWRDRPGFAQTMEQVTGLAWLTGHRDDQPRIQRGPCDPNGGMHAAFAAMVALARRDRTGIGSLVEAPMFEAAVAIAAELVLEWTAYGTALQRDGNRSRRAAPQGVYACAGTEQWLAVSVLDDEQWASLVDALGRPAWAADPALATVSGRHERHDDLDRHLSQWSATIALGDAVDLLIAAGVPAAPAFEPRQTHTNPQLADRGYFELVDHPVAGVQYTPTLPFRFGSVDHWVKAPAPTLGQHNNDVLTAIGLTPEQIDALIQSGVIGNAPANL